MKLTRQEAVKAIEGILSQTEELFDAIQVLAGWHTREEGTQTYYSGRGMWHARKEMARELVKSSDHDNLSYHIARRMPTRSDDDDSESSFS